MNQKVKQHLFPKHLLPSGKAVLCISPQIHIQSSYLLLLSLTMLNTPQKTAYGQSFVALLVFQFSAFVSSCCSAPSTGPVS